MKFEIRLLVLRSDGWQNTCPYGYEVDGLSLEQLRAKIDQDLVTEDLDNKLYTGKSDLWYLSVKEEGGSELLAIRTPLGWQ